MVLVGNQVDLEKERTVNQIQGQEFAKKWNWSFFETSAKQGINVEEAFRTLIKQMDESQRMKKKEGRAFAWYSLCLFFSFDYFSKKKSKSSLSSSIS